jgi:hypothetical protein
MLFLRVSDDGIWHRMFLDAGIEFWGTLPEEDAFDAYEEHRRIDEAERWGLVGERIVTAECVDAGQSEFRIGFAHGALVFRYVDRNSMDSDTMLEFESARE